MSDTFTDDKLAVRKLRPWDEQVGLDASITNVAKGKRAINRGMDKQTSMIPLPYGPEAKFYAHSSARGTQPLNRSVPKVDPDNGVKATHRQMLAGDNLRNVGPKVFYKRHDFHKVRDHLIDGFNRNLAREQCRAADKADELALERMEMEHRQQVHTKALFNKLEQQCKERGFEGTKKAPMRKPAEEKKTFTRTLKDPEAMRKPMERWAPHDKTLW